jgi:hypothetical protein
MKHVIKALAATSIVAIVAVIAMPSGAAFAKPLSEAQWKRQANAACKQVSKDVEELTNEVFAGLGENEQPSPSQVSTWVEQFAPLVRDAVASIDALNEPKAVKSALKKFEAATLGAVEEIEADPVAAFSYEHDPFAKANKIAKKLGLRACASG